MPHVRMSGPAKIDLASIIETSATRWGREASRRYAANVAAAIRSIGESPQGQSTQDRSSLVPGMRSLHLRRARKRGQGKVQNPVHVIFFRSLGPELVEVLRILHERMDPAHHIGPDTR